MQKKVQPTIRLTMRENRKMSAISKQAAKVAAIVTESLTPNPPQGPTPGEMLAMSFHEMLEGWRNVYAKIGDLEVKALIERAEKALEANQ